MIRILVGSPVHQAADVLNEFLISLEELNKDGLEVDYCFVDDNRDKDSKALLQEFKKRNKGTTVLDSAYDIPYFVNDYTHNWSEDLILKVTEFKNEMIRIALEKEYDYIFFIDSDIVLHPKTIKRLLETKKDIVANVFWTKWNPQAPEMPQVWLKDSYTMFDSNGLKPITQAEAQQQTTEFLEMLKKPGTYKVGGLGACTLISRKALLQGVNFNPIYNISFWGEDRAFCIRAVALGLELFADTYYPAYHIYRSENLAGVKEFKANKDKRETEIIGSKILDLIIETVQSANRYSYKDELDLGFAKNCTKPCADKLKKLLLENKTKSMKDKVINNLQIMECQMTFYNNNTAVRAIVKYNENGYKGDYSVYKEAEGECVLKSNRKGEWLVDDWNFIKRKIPSFIPLVRKSKEKENKLTLSMIVKNEGDRYLRRCLESAREYIDNAVIIDDGSTDNTKQVIREVLKDIPFTLIENKESKFNNETNLRKQQWFETIATNPDWIIFLDADEIFEEKFKDEIRDMLDDRDMDGYIFRLYDFWDEENYRNDKLWYAHYTYRSFMIRYQKNFRYEFTETAQHCGRMPANCMSLKHGKSELRLKHYGWAKEEDRLEKYNRYMKLDPNGEFGSLEQYQSILDPEPIVSKWSENE